MNKIYPSINISLFPIYEYLLKTFITSYQDVDYLDLINNQLKKIQNIFFTDEIRSLNAFFNNTDVLLPDYFTKICIEKGMQKYFDLYKKYPDLYYSVEFFSKTNFLFSNFLELPKVYFSEDSVKVIAVYREKKFSINYDYGYDDSLFISLDTGNKMIVKECEIDSILPTLESYFELPKVITSAA